MARSEITLDIAGVESVRKRLRLVPRELAAAGRRAAPRAGQRARAVAKRELRSAGVGSTTLKRRVLGQRERLWIGANPVAATLKLRKGKLGAGEFPLNIAGVPRMNQPIFRRLPNGRIEPVPFPIDEIARIARDAAATEALERFEEVLVTEGEKILIKAGGGTV